MDGIAAYIVYVTSLAILRTVMARGKWSHEWQRICASIAVLWSFRTFCTSTRWRQLKTHRHIQWAHRGVCNGQTDFALTLTIWPEKNLWPPHFRTFCELVEGEENKLTTFSTWTIMLGCNESNINFQQHLCKLGQLWRRNGRNSQVFGQAMKKRPTGHTLWLEKEIYGRHTFVLFVS